MIGAISSMNVDKITHSVSKLSNVLAGQMAGVVAVLNGCRTRTEWKSGKMPDFLQTNN